MTTAKVLVTLAGLALIGLVNWWFFTGGQTGRRAGGRHGAAG